MSEQAAAQIYVARIFQLQKALGGDQRQLEGDAVVSLLMPFNQRVRVP